MGRGAVVKLSLAGGFTRKLTPTEKSCRRPFHGSREGQVHDGVLHVIFTPNTMLARIKIIERKPALKPLKLSMRRNVQITQDV
jgi:hypothetical protein